MRPKKEGGGEAERSKKKEEKKRLFKSRFFFRRAPPKNARGEEQGCRFPDFFSVFPENARFFRSLVFQSDTVMTRASYFARCRAKKDKVS